MVATPKRTPPSETMALATAKKMVKESGPLLRTLFETLMVAIQGKIRTWIRGKPTSQGHRRREHSHHANKAEDAALRPLAQVDGWQARHDEQAAQQHDDRGRIVHPAGDRLSGTSLRTQQVARRDYHRPNEEDNLLGPREGPGHRPAGDSPAAVVCCWAACSSWRACQPSTCASGRRAAPSALLA